jgi:hypothetical protein
VFSLEGNARIAEIPTAQALDDSLPFSARHTHARVVKIWREEFDALYREGCLVPLTVHLRGDLGFTRAARIAALEELLAYMASRPGVRFMTGAALAAQALASREPAEPDPDPRASGNARGYALPRRSRREADLTMRLNGRKVLITGGASGIGLATARRFVGRRSARGAARPRRT